MVAQNRGYFGTKSPAKERAYYAGVNPPAVRRGEFPNNVDESFAGNPERGVLASDLLEQVRRCARFHPEECLYLDWTLKVHMDGWTIREAAIAMGVHYSTAKQRIRRTLKFLEQYIGEQEHKA